MYRRKRSKIITRVMVCAIKTGLKKDLKGQESSILVDEATDLGTAKHQCRPFTFSWNREGI